ncbi:hypothetical protein [Carboxylicivirga marina]|uniref:DUF4890 domain-containing protein n=1 Tax=Carboxylicivirga marina TaxID=2800988 RepID=A0ABS1HQH7_9BACT|nr:hypothetical protein [Carboxylicivirga marina]MBK3519939.1 hypothetical protein [Carboxylicivirga marina]
MKKLLIVLTIILLAINVQAQKKNTPEAKAEKISKEMQTVLAFDQTSYESVYALQLKHFTKEKELKATSNDDKEALKAGKKEIMQAMNLQLKELLGKEEIQKWQAHVKAKKKKKDTPKA